MLAKQSNSRDQVLKHKLLSRIEKEHYSKFKDASPTELKLYPLGHIKLKYVIIKIEIGTNLKEKKTY